MVDGGEIEVENKKRKWSPWIWLSLEKRNDGGRDRH